VMGVSGVGKSTVAVALAAELGVECGEGDDLHPAANVALMAAGAPLTDDDRRVWLDAVGRWLAAHDGAGGVISRSALKRSYRDSLRAAAPRATFAHLVADHETVLARMHGRDHFMPASMLDSQEVILEPLQSDESGWTIESKGTPSPIIEALVRDIRRGDESVTRDNLQ
ncbi:MAG: gluconokinase, partial [Aeromicrobium sp.]